MFATLDGSAVDADRLRTLALVNFGHFTTMRVEDGGVRGLGAHLERLVRDCGRVFEVDLDPDRVRRNLRDTLAGLDRPVLARVTVFDPLLEVGDLAAAATPSVLVTLRPAAVDASPRPGVRLRTAVYQRELPSVKHVGQFGPMRLRRAAQRRGADDVLFVGTDGAICETAIANIGFIDGDRVVWPRAEWLPGVTMRLISSVIPTSTETVTVADLGRLDAAFVTNAAIGIQSVAGIDDVHWAAEPSTLRHLRNKYLDVEQEPL